jgi:hypothetical protein
VANLQEDVKICQVGVENKLDIDPFYDGIGGDSDVHSKAMWGIIRCDQQI